jgi:hypothetical protein
VTTPSLTLLLPGALVDPDWLGPQLLAECATGASLSALARRVGRIEDCASPHPAVPEPGHEHWLHQHFGLDARTPLAACAPFADGDPDAHWRIDPVHLHIGRDHLVLTDPATLDLSIDDAQSLAQAIAPLLADEGLALRTPTAGRWTLHQVDAQRPLRLRTHSLAGAIGRSIEARMPDGEDARRWRRIVNEIQMTWFAHPLTEEREVRGLRAANSLWIEGPCPDSRMLDDAGLQRLAGAARVASRDLTQSADPGHPAPPFVLRDTDTVLRIDDRLLQAQLSGDPLAWRAAWQSLDSTLLASIVRGEAEARTGARLVLTGDSGWRSLDIAARPDWRFWRRPDPRAWLEPVRAAAGVAA